MTPLQVLSLVLPSLAILYWCYRTGEINGYEQGYDDGIRRGFQKGKAAAQPHDPFENHR